MENLETRKKIGVKLRELRKQAGFKAYDSFAFTHELEKSTVLRAETGGNIKLDTLLTLLKIHGVSLKEFFEDFK
jgi:transcriptional regulator with XRE-family HTH domain